VRRLTLITAILAIIALVGGVAGAADAPIKVGATPVPHAEILEFIKPFLAEVGVDLQIVEFTDYVQPNLALSDGELDANYFQHIPYLETFSADHRLDLAVLVKVHIEPMGLYSHRVDSLEELRDGAIIAIPNDVTNGGRALLLLQDAGLITLRDGVGLQATPLDVTSNPKRLQFRELEAAMLPRVLADVDAAVINTNFALEAGLDPLADSLVIEGAESPYANVVAVRTPDLDREELLKLAEAITRPEVREFIVNKYGGAVVPVF